MSLAVRAMVPDDLPAFEALTRLRPGFDEARAATRTRVIEHLAFRNPVSDGAPTYFVAADGDRLLVHLGRMPTRFFVGGVEERGAFGHDLFSDPELRANGRAFFTTMQLYRAIEQATGGVLALAWTNELNVELQRSRGVTELWVRRWVRPLELSSQSARWQALAEHERALTRTLFGVVDALAGLRFARERSVRKEQDVDARFDELAERVGPRLGIAPVKDAAYLRWKYLTHPALRVALYSASRAGELCGFVVVRERTEPREPSRILELVADPEDEVTLGVLVSAAIEHARTSGARTIDALATEPAIARALRGMLFFERPPNMPLFFLDRSERRAERTLSIERWNHAFGDSEGGEVP